MDFLEKIEEFVKISVKRYGHLWGQGVYYKQIARRRPSMKTIKAKILVLSAFALLLLSLVGCSSLFSSEEDSTTCDNNIEQKASDDGRYIITEVGHIGNARGSSDRSSD